MFLDALPWGVLSFYKQPWRGYLETIPGVQFLSGIGINYNAPLEANHAVVMKLLADSGFKSIRLEIGWNSVDWAETTLANPGVLDTVFSACRLYGIVPVVTLNSNDGGPCPSKTYRRTVVAGGQVGSRRVQLDSVADLVAGYSGISNLSGYWMAEAIFTSINAGTNTVELSKPLSKAIPSGSQITLNTLKYLPLYPIGTPQFEQSAAGWLTYAKVVLDQARASGLTNMEVEIWNELTFGSNFLSINNYYQPAIVTYAKADWFAPGGHCWELARRTVDFVRARYPGTKVIWGFSNTTFFHTPIASLPPGTDGQSYHPYGTNKKVIPKDYPPRERYPFFLEHFIPRNLVWCMPEGWPHLGIAVEQLMQLLNPATRLSNRPKGTSSFSHYMTEHGFGPREAGITDRNQALSHKAKSAIRSLLFWLNKGIVRMEIFCAYDTADQGFGLLFAQPAPKSYASYAEQQLTSPVLQAIKNVVGQFAGSQALGQPRQLAVDVTSIGAQYKVFDGDAGHPPLYYRDMFTFLPFQVNARKFICAVYVMSYDITNPPPPATYRLTVRNVNGTMAQISLYDPISNQAIPVKTTGRTSSQFSVQLQAVEYPRLLVINE